jgi:AcrR family transcriptional regulator
VPRLTADNLLARRRTILDGARRSFARDGYEGATVRRLEAEIGLSRGAIFHHFRDKESLFFAGAEDDAPEIASLRTDADFRNRWAARSERISAAARHRLQQGVDRGTLRTDVPVETLAAFLELVLDGLVLHRAMGVPDDDLDAVLDLVESMVRRPE